MFGNYGKDYGLVVMALVGTNGIGMIGGLPAVGCDEMQWKRSEHTGKWSARYTVRRCPFCLGEHSLDRLGFVVPPCSERPYGFFLRCIHPTPMPEDKPKRKSKRSK